MSLSQYPLSAITADHIRSLKDNGVRESRDLDYKQAYGLGEDAQKRDFVRDIAAFANTVGGDLVYGIEENDGVATNVPGIAKLAEDDERLRIETLVAAALSPRLSGLEFKKVPLENGNAVFIVRVPRSMNAPHMVIYGGDNRFFGRHGSGKFMMDVHQVRDRFATSDAIANKLRAFRDERLRWIEQREVGVRLPSPHLTVVHLLPLSSVRDGEIFDGRSLRKIESAKLQPLRDNGGWGEILNLDGLRVQSSLGGGKIVGYVQLFRNGCMEVVDTDMIHPGRQQAKIIPPAYERTVRKGVHRLVGTMRELGLDGAIAVGLSLLQVRGFVIFQEDDRDANVPPIEVESLVHPEVVIEGGASVADIDSALRPSFDLVWNACGKIGSPNYNGDGSWKAEVDAFRVRR